jgi:hypothetical protein
MNQLYDVVLAVGWMTTCRGETAPLAPQDSGRGLRAAELR